MLLPLLLAFPASAGTAHGVVADMVGAWHTLRSYRAVQSIQERLDGELTAEQRMRVAFRKPWEIQLTWETVHEGRKAYWNPSRNGGEVLVYPGGLTGRAFGILSFSIDNAILKRDTRHTLAEAGFGYLAERIGRVFDAGAHPEALSVVRESATDGGTVVLGIGSVPGLEYGRAELTVSARTRLPVAFSGWDAKGQLVERFAWGRVELDAPIAPTTDFDLAYR